MSIDKIKKLNKASLISKNEQLSILSLYKAIELITDELSREHFTDEVREDIVSTVMSKVKLPENGKDGKDYVITQDDINDIVSMVSELVDDGQDGDDYVLTDSDIDDIVKRISAQVENGKDYILSQEDLEEIASMVKVEVPEIKEKTADEVRELLESLKGDDRLDVSAIKGLDEKLQFISRSSGAAGKRTTKLSQLVDVDLDNLTIVNDKYVLGSVGSIVAGDNILVDDTDPANPIVTAEIPPSIIIDTRANILAQTPENGTEGFSTDFDKKYLYYNGWYEQSSIYDERVGSEDVGAVQNGNLSGYGQDYISDKHLANVTLGESRDDKVDSIRITTIDGQKFVQAYINGGWKTVLTGINIEVDLDEPDVETTNFGNYRISLITGNSDAKDGHGTPIVQNMQTDIGAIQTPLVIKGVL